MYRLGILLRDNNTIMMARESHREDVGIVFGLSWPNKAQSEARIESDCSPIPDIVGCNWGARGKARNSESQRWKCTETNSVLPLTLSHPSRALGNHTERVGP